MVNTFSYHKSTTPCSLFLPKFALCCLVLYCHLSLRNFIVDNWKLQLHYELQPASMETIVYRYYFYFMTFYNHVLINQVVNQIIFNHIIDISVQFLSPHSLLLFSFLLKFCSEIIHIFCSPGSQKYFSFFKRTWNETKWPKIVSNHPKYWALVILVLRRYSSTWGFVATRWLDHVVG